MKQYERRNLDDKKVSSKFSNIRNLVTKEKKSEKNPTAKMRRPSVL